MAELICEKVVTSFPDQSLAGEAHHDAKRT